MHAYILSCRQTVPQKSKHAKAVHMKVSGTPLRSTQACEQIFVSQLGSASKINFVWSPCHHFRDMLS